MLLALLVLALASAAHADTIVAIAYPGAHSHQLILAKIGRELVARGHEFIYVHSSLDALNKNNWDGLRVLTYQAPMSSDEWDAVSPRIVELDPIGGAMLIFEIHETFCKAILANETIMQSVGSARLLLADAIFNCATLISDIVKSPIRVDFIPVGVADPLFTTPYGIDSPTSYFPMSGTKLGTGLTFADRIKNNILYFINTRVIIPNFAQSYVDKIRAERGLPGSHAESQAKTGIVLAQSTWGLEFSHPIVPAFKVVGPILPEPGKPVPPELEAFIQSAGDHGVIYVSLGTILYPSQNVISRLKAALVSLPSSYKIIWKLNMDVGELPDNIKVLSWAPQNDLLAHPKVSAFLSHGGLNGVQEAAYHGIPVVGFPLFGDQFENLIRVRERGYGIILDRDEFSPESLASSIHEVVHNPVYRQNAKRISKIVRDAKTAPTKECADWIEYALRHDGALFNVLPAYSQPFWVYYNLDVFALLSLVAATVLYVVVVAVPRKLFRLVFKKAAKPKDQ